MLNYRFVALLILLACVISPLAFQWFTNPEGSWLRPYVAWLVLIISSALVYHRRRRKGQI
ncbi:hypothetical protein KFE80_11940 [bacterium SCSIO 12696]|nr:hypothetical protein KFE80_11940 [bacterium SCSIO 12696]